MVREKTGEIIWGVDWTSYELEQPGVATGS
jgi:hypothetical protein